MKKVFLFVIAATAFFVTYAQSDVETADPKLKKDKELTHSLSENVLTGLERSFSKEKFMTDRNNAYQFAIQQRKEPPPVNPLQAFFNR